MTVLSAASTADIDAPLARCWELIQALERAPEWQTGLTRLDVVERDPAGRPAVCDVIFDVKKVHRVHCRVRVGYEPRHRLTFTRLESDDVDLLEGSWELEALSDQRTRATYRLTVDPGPVPRVARPLVKALHPLVVGGRAEELARAVAGRD